MSGRWPICLALSAVGCVPIDGGAIELGWDVRDEDGARLSCESAGIARVRLVGEALERGAAIDAAFGCDEGWRRSVSTGFDVAPGRYLLTVEPIGDDGERLGPGEGVCPPSPLERDVARGEATDLGILLMVVGC